MKTIIIEVQTGVAYVYSKPKDVQIDIVDYDIEGTDQEKICHCKYGGLKTRPHSHQWDVQP